MQIPQEKEIISETKKLFVFNPEHDFALAVGQGSYTPPAEVIKIRKNYSLLPASFAGNSDFILVPDEINEMEISQLPFYDQVIKKQLKIINRGNLSKYASQISKIIPWGWDHAIYKDLVANNIDPSILPNAEDLDNIRKLSHRRTTIPFRQFLAKELNSEIVNLPRECYSVQEIENFIKTGSIYYFKAPWSSSGRGIVVSDHISKKGLFEWLHGIIRRQGSVIVEPAWNKIFDFATEWEISGGEAKFLGYAVFRTSSRGKYHGNVTASQEQLLHLIKEVVPNFNNDIIEIQNLALNKMISPYYSGPVGIDMLVDTQGNINPCVEINLRFTMGHLSIYHFNNS